MTAVFVITPKNRTPQSLKRHSAPVYQLEAGENVQYKEIKTKTLDIFLSLYDGCVQALPTHISVQST